ncbi:MAG: type II secretion system secretin GspD [Gammaproteobacteria bacterium]|nr:type II secretion system secretin GspD [Gammaproteobacteria bacterium]NND54411.1 type II secretion system secretin GspD [Gammaproteobacteria bacterium]
MNMYSAFRQPTRTGAFARTLLLGLVSVALLLPGLLRAQATITPNYKDADIAQVIEAVGAITGKNFIIDPRVKAQVTMISSTPMSAEAFYEAFLSILQVYGFVAVPSGDVIKILPDANARQMPGWENAAAGNRRADDIVTQVVMVRNIAAAQLVPILRPLIPQYGHLAAHPASNMLIISDRSANVERILSIVRRIDQSGDDEYEVIRLEHASAAETVRVVGALQQGSGAEGGKAITVVADERTNSILISGDKNNRLRMRTLIAHLDTPLEDGGDTQVRYLRYADSADLATKLETQYQNASGDPSIPPTATADVTIWADEQTNALVITAPPKIMRSMMTVIDKLDIRRAQVLVEAIIVEVSGDTIDQLGITWAALGTDDIIGITQSDLTTSIGDFAGLVTGGDATTIPPIDNGGTFGIGRINESGSGWAALIQALEADSNTNVMSSPTIVTLDNEEAEINVGQEVPFVTGSFSNTGSTGGAVNPFQTVQREQVGLKLKITPQINEGDAVLLKLEQEISDLAARGEAVDLVTTNRTLTTSVIVEDEGILVLGGLIQDNMTEQVQKVPILGSIPLLGRLFRSEKVQLTKTNLMLFIKPTILRDSVATAFETNEKYRLIRELQQADRQDRGLYFRDVDRPILPELEERITPALDLRGLDDGSEDDADTAMDEDATDE